MGEELVGYMLEVHGKSFVHVWYQAYAKRFVRHYAGFAMYIDLLRRAKQTGYKYLYFGVTYGQWMSYKTNFQPLSYWDGMQWVEDPNSHQLKKLLAVDTLRMLTFTDAWREQRLPYYKAPYRSTDVRSELRLFYLMLSGMPRITFFLTVVLMIVMAFIMLRIIIL